MKILIAPDSFKHALSAQEAIDALTAGLNTEAESQGWNLQITGCPMADGGEGTSQILARALQADRVPVSVTGPLGQPVEAWYYLSKDRRTAVMEMASASGIELIRPEERNPLVATTYGTGELIRHALDQGVERIIIGIGGSATVDGGIGMADALGFRFYDAKGGQLPALAQNLVQIHHIETAQADPRISQLRVDIASDVQSLLTGEKGAARVFGPQKGADPGMVAVLESGLEHLLGVWKAQGMLENQAPGDGAAGGLGAGLRAFLGAESASGAELVGRLGGFLDELVDSQVVITGEGQTDDQTGSGKVCGYVAAQARNRGIPVILVSGGLAGDFSQLLNVYDLAFSISPGVMSLDAALAAARENLEYYGRLIARILYRSWPVVMERESGRHR